jgi:hypothetical protein
MLSALITTAQARRFSLSEQHITAEWSGERLLKFEGGLGVEVQCHITMEGSFHSKTLSKVCGQLVGYITRAAVERPCVEAPNKNAWVLNGIEVEENGAVTPQTLPWHVRYNSFTGTLPAITRIRLQLVGAAFLIRINEVRCLVQTTAARPALGDIELTGGVATTLRPVETQNISPTVTLGGLCFAGHFANQSNKPSVQGTTTLITVTLVQ